MSVTREEARRRLLARIGPHKQASDVCVVDVPARGGVMAHKDFLVETACGREVPATLAASRDDLVRCPDCRSRSEAGQDGQ